MAYDLEEQEQLAELKAWWKQYGRLVIVGTLAFVLSLSGYQGWRHYRASQAATAAMLYEQLALADRAADHKRVRDIASKLAEAHRSTTYAVMAALASAKAAFLTGDLPAARTQLQWAIERAKEGEIRDVARLRLAGVLLDEKNPDEALKVLEAKPGDAFVGRFADLRGDILVVQGKNDQARASYRTALEKSDAQGQYRQMIQVKLDSLGEPK